MIRRVKSNAAILSIISISLLLSLTVWFSANAIAPQITSLWMLNEYDIALLSMILIIGFGFNLLALGPLIGILSLILLREEPDSIKIGQGKK